MQAREGPSGDEYAGLAQRFIAFAENECGEYEPLYDALSRAIARDRELLELASYVRSGQPAPNMIFACVQYMLLGGADHPLAGFYRSLTLRPESPAEAFPIFRQFCLENGAHIRHLLSTRLVQTNEVGRSALLMPAFAHVAAVAGGAPLALIEIGPSGGLNLVHDRYHFDYGDGLTAGDPESAVQLVCRREGNIQPPVRLGPARIGFRVGIDLNPVDVTQADEALWLRALVWPQRPERLELLNRAIEVLSLEPPELVQGDAAELLPELLERAPKDLTLCVFHSFVMHQVPPEGRTAIVSAMAEESRRRPLFEVSVAISDGMDAQMEMARNVRGEWRRSVLATCQAHGQSIRWLM